MLTALPVLRRRLTAALLVGSLPAAATAQGFGNEWVEFQKDNSRLVADGSLGLDDTDEKDYAFADLDKDGWTDLVVVRKQPFTTSGRRANVLFMNDNGLLVDRTSLYATDSSVSGDQGFLTPTNDRDVVVVDVDGDTWLDVVTATTLSANQPKHISHPRVYVNKGEDQDGNWLGLRFEDDRFPQLYLSSGQPSWPRFCSVDGGDVTGDGFADLYFGDYDSGGSGGGDMNDRLVVNDGTGHFIDESAMRMTQQMLESAFGNSVVIADMNLDGANDIVKDTSLNAPQYVSVSYNDPGNEGYFDLFDIFHNFAPYHTNAGDLNNDGRIDVVITDDGDDRFRYNLSTDIFGRVVWGPALTFDFVTGGDDGFGGDNYVVDLDDDGWSDVIVTDVDVDISGCSRRMHVYHNPGGNTGDQIVLREEAESGPGGWRGAVGLYPDDLRGMHDVAVFDIDGDGDLDMVLGRCTGTDVWLNRLVDGPAPDVGTPYCFCDAASAPCSNPGATGEGCANSTGSGATLTGLGSASASADDLRFRAEGLLPGQPALLFVGDDTVANGAGVPFGDGLRCAGTNVVRLGVGFPDAQGSATWGPGLGAQGGWGAGDLRHFQAWYRDPSGSPCGAGFNLTHGVELGFVQ